jgi:hypothetical protein
MAVSVASSLIAVSHLADSPIVDYALVASARRRHLESLVLQTRDLLDGDDPLSDAQCDELRLAAGKATLLLTKKLVKFDQLVQRHLVRDPR